MDESNIRGAIQHALQWRGYWAEHRQDGRIHICQRCHQKNLILPEVKGRPDIQATHPYPQFPTALIETKAVLANQTSFDFNLISEDQRRWLSRWSEDGGHAYLGIGKIVPQGSRTTIHSIYVIPWSMWLTEEGEDKSMPYSYELFTNNVEQRSRDLVSRFPVTYQLSYYDGDWHFYSVHPLAVRPEVTNPFHRRKRSKDGPKLTQDASVQLS